MSLNEPYNREFHYHEIKNAINNLPTDKACGLDYVHNQFLLNLPQNKRQILLGIYNKLWKEGKVPDEWKIGLIIPILKPGKEAEIAKSYRPISLLSCLSKLFEKMVADRLTYLIETNNLLSPTQSGFRIRRSTIDPIIALEHEIRKTLVTKKTTIVVFFDLTSAFDSVDHIILLKTLVQKI